MKTHLTHNRDKGFPVTKIVSAAGEHIVIDRMEWRDEALVCTVSALPKVLAEPDLWNFVTAASNHIGTLCTMAEALKRSSVVALAQNIDGLILTASNYANQIETFRKRMLPMNYPNKSVKRSAK